MCTYMYTILHIKIIQLVCEKEGAARHVFVKHRCPWQQQSQNMTKSPSPTFWPPPHPQGHVMSVKYEQLLDELSVQHIQVWLKYHHSNIKYFTLFVSSTELRLLRTNGRKKTRRTTQLLDAQADLSRRRHKNVEIFQKRYHYQYH